MWCTFMYVLKNVNVSKNVNEKVSKMHKCKYEYKHRYFIWYYKNSFGILFDTTWSFKTNSVPLKISKLISQSKCSVLMFLFKFVFVLDLLRKAPQKRH